MSRRSWETFVYQGVTYSLAHLDSFEIEVRDAQKQPRSMAVNFSDHCFTKSYEEGIDPELRYPSSTREGGGFFCLRRYHLSLGLPTMIRQAVDRKVWNLAHEHYALLPTIDLDGQEIFYGIVFSLDPIHAPGLDLILRVRSAHPRDEREMATFGEVRFAHLISLRLLRKHAERDLRRGRKRPGRNWKPGQR